MKKNIMLLFMLSLLVLVPIFVTGQTLDTLDDDETDLGLGIRSGIPLRLLNQKPDPVEPGEEVEIAIEVASNGEYYLKDVGIFIKEEFPFYHVDKSKAIVYLGDLDHRYYDEDSFIIRFSMLVSENAPEGNQELEVGYVTKEYSALLEPITIRVESRDSVLAVEKVSLYPERPKPGENVHVNITLQNLAQSALDDVKVKLDLGDSTSVAPLTSSSEKVFRKILAGESKTVDFDLIVAPDAVSRLELLGLMIEYTNKFNEMHNTTSKLGLPIYDPPQYELSMEETNVFLREQQGEFVVSFSNLGTSDINFVMLSLEESDDYEILSNNKVYVGNLESDDYETASFEIYTHDIDAASKTIPLKFLLRYKDSFNQEFTLEKEIPLRIYNKEEAVKFGLVEPNSYAWVFFLVIIVVGIFLYRRYKKKKKAK